MAPTSGSVVPFIHVDIEVEERYWPVQVPVTVWNMAAHSEIRRMVLLSKFEDVGYMLFVFWTRKGSLIAKTVVLVLVVVLVVTRFRKMPKASLICNGKLRNLAHTFTTSFPLGLPS